MLPTSCTMVFTGEPDCSPPEDSEPLEPLDEPGPFGSSEPPAPDPSPDPEPCWPPPEAPPSGEPPPVELPPPAAPLPAAEPTGPPEPVADPPALASPPWLGAAPVGLDPWMAPGAGLCSACVCTGTPLCASPVARLGARRAAPRGRRRREHRPQCETPRASPRGGAPSRAGTLPGRLVWRALDTAPGLLSCPSRSRPLNSRQSARRACDGERRR